MSDEPENLVLVYLRRIDAKVDGLDRRIDDLTQRMSAVETGLASVRRDLGFLAEADARLQMSFDRLRDDVTRIERRLDLVDEPAA
jgi:predicted nuclease with TOPRIM domain